jgi:hypothetical protein
LLTCTRKASGTVGLSRRVLCKKENACACRVWTRMRVRVRSVRACVRAYASIRGSVWVGGWAVCVVAHTCTRRCSPCSCPEAALQGHLSECRRQFPSLPCAIWPACVRVHADDVKLRVRTILDGQACSADRTSHDCVCVSDAKTSGTCGDHHTHAHTHAQHTHTHTRPIHTHTHTHTHTHELGKVVRHLPQ